jgi:folylpolyglutamate synthase/dihydropteroate synthase
MAATTSPPRDIAHALRALRSLQISGQAWMRQHVSTPQQVQQATYAHAKTLRVDLSALPPVIHIAGTKGKGSTAAICESLLRKGFGLRTGLFTSPHLVSPIERFRVKGEFVDESLFLSEFWNAWDSLGGPADASSEWSGPSPPLPGFNLLTLLAFKIFTEASCDVVVLETGVGGRFDATNVVPRPIACAITTLDLEHVDLLGPTLRDIAWQKGGIIKPGVPCVTAPQEDEGMRMLNQCATEAGSSLFLCPPFSQLQEQAGLKPGMSLELGLEGRFQLINTSIAVSLVDMFIRHQKKDNQLAIENEATKSNMIKELILSSIPNSSSSTTTSSSSSSSSFSFETPPPLYTLQEDFFSENVLKALKETRFDGRAQILDVMLPTSSGKPVDVHEAIRDHSASRSLNNIVARVPLKKQGAARVYIDGSHTYLSTREASLWFSESSGKSSLSPTDNIRSVLIFNCGLDKDTLSILNVLTKLNFDTIIFVPTAGGISAPPTQSKNTPSTHHPLSALAALERYKMSTRNINNKDISVSDSDFINVEALEERLTPSLAIDRDGDNVLQDALHWQKSLAQLWKALREEGGSKRERSSSESNVYVETSAESALTRIFIESSGERPSSHIFVTGSLYLVGDVLRTLQTK